MDRNKIAAYLGFAIKSRQIVFGEDGIKTAKGVRTVLIESNTTDKYKERVRRSVNNINCLEIENLSELLHRENVKAVAVLDKNLATAIETNIQR